MSIGRSASSAASGLVVMAEANFVWTTPGQTALTRMFSGAHCAATAFVRPRRAVLETEYVERTGKIW